MVNTYSMKRMKSYIPVLLLACLAAVSCTQKQEPEESAFIGRPIRFVTEAPGTRATYSGEVIDGKERIEWQAGDRVCIYSPEAAGRKFSIYKIEGETHESGSVSSASTALSVAVDSIGALQWGKLATHRFYGRYPDPSCEIPYMSDEYHLQAYASSDFVCFIPEQQTAIRVGNTETFQPDTSYCYMTAYAEADPLSDVSLHFTPVVNVFEVCFTNNYPDRDISISSLELRSSSHQLSGNFTVHIDKHPTFTFDERWLSYGIGKSAFANFETPVVVTPGNSLTATIYTCPVTVAGTEEDHLTLIVTLEDGIERSFPLKSKFSWLCYEPCGKYRINVRPVGTPIAPGAFSVANGRQVTFAPGNLQYTKSTDTWSFMEHQYSIVETGDMHVGENYADQDVVSLFGWATSGYNNRLPYLTSCPNGGPEISSGEFSYEWDWGSNHISNGGAYRWRTLSSGEWQYLYNRTDGSGRRLSCYARITSCGYGRIFFPDGFDLAGCGINLDFTPSYRYPTISAAQWASLEAAGCAFLPFASFRESSYVYTYVGVACRYWTSTAAGSYYAYAFYDEEDDNRPSFTYDASRNNGCSVRLVRDIQL